MLNKITVVGAGNVGAGGGGGFNDVHDIFNEVFGQAFGDMFGAGRGRQNNGPARGQDLRYDLEITLEQAYAGAEVEISVPAAMSCETCNGSGAKPGTSPTPCGTCGGAGRVRDALTVTRLIDAIPAFETESAALANFA